MRKDKFTLSDWRKMESSEKQHLINHKDLTALSR